MPDGVSDELAELVPLIEGLDNAVPDDEADAEVAAVCASEGGRRREGKGVPGHGRHGRRQRRRGPSRTPAAQLPRLANKQAQVSQARDRTPESCCSSARAAPAVAGVVPQARCNDSRTSEAVALAPLVRLLEPVAVAEAVSEALADWVGEAVADCGVRGEQRMEIGCG